MQPRQRGSAAPVDPDELSFSEGETLVRLARRSVEHYFEHGSVMPVPQGLPENLYRPGAAFVTIETYHGPDKRELRGCIGVIRPIEPLAETVIRVALESAFNDPRFPPLRREELDTVTFEVEVLSDLEYLGDTPEERIAGVEIGRDGLLVVDTLTGRQGLLLPVVPVDYGWDVKTFLDQTCIKAGMWPGCWRHPAVRVYRFRARAWREKYPRGPVEERNLREEYKRRLEARRAGAGEG